MRKLSKILAPTVVVGLVFGTVGYSVSAATETVESGETLWGIAQEHDVSTDELINLNSDLDPQMIPVGTEIQLDANENNNGNENTTGEMVSHTVQPGNTLLGIASLYDGVTLDNIYQLNEGIDPYNLMVGSEVTVVGNNNQSSESTDGDVVYHIVQPGNTFNEIASVYNYVTAEEIMNANPNVNASSLPVGTEIVIPLD
ncbi:LysM peptidoglycan-binding domain-containing protein [Aquibacillus rhizosphaerae]|uniref:LysM peptidoglycan-binding domain-containing protein n=1 Tax=Aquibacillus rhizosphaerae TaxID=3051431 RepID=A0ABT7LB78_9BACI|nr:LysM peptidoglycan-binding domain-containing protein [Aquibacillus sp. LR5S19]MDL4843123.1 LysM peptidoglycan-binding domain-containing protein [Aquibacillus sp. LR5S19]